MEKLKAIVSDDAFFYSLLVVLVGVVAFGLGRHSADTNSDAVVPAIKIIQAARPTQPAAVVEAAPASSEVQSAGAGAAAAVVASKNGTKYHLPTCPGAKQIKAANRIEFASIDLARAAGYEPAKNCAGLE